jgi:hypothetical protein
MIYEYRAEMRDIPRPFCSYDLPQYRQRNVVREGMIVPTRNKSPLKPRVHEAFAPH